jgi:hypothetical protein
MSTRENSNIRREQNRFAHEIAIYVRITRLYKTWLEQVLRPADATE